MQSEWVPGDGKQDEIYNEKSENIWSLAMSWLQSSLCLMTGIPRPMNTYRPLGYERVYMPPYKMVATPFHIQKDAIFTARDCS